MARLVSAFARLSKSAFLFSLVFCHAAGAETLLVPENFSSIQRAIDSAAGGDVVEVSPGSYRENLALVDNVAVRGTEAARTLLFASDDSLPIISANGITNALIANLTLADSSVGVQVVNSTSITIASNVFDRLRTAAVTLDLVSSGEVINNVFYRNVLGIDRATPAVSIVNNIFAENQSTIVSSAIVPIDPGFDVSFNCFNRNDDLGQSGADTGLGSNFQVGNPLFVNASGRDFHLRDGSVCIDAGSGVDAIDATVADIGAYGGLFADAVPYILPQPDLSNASSGDATSIRVTWQANEDYRVTNDSLPGGYRVWYRRNQAGPPYDGTDAGNGTLASPIDVGNVTEYTIADLQPDATVPGAPVLVSASPQNRSVRLAWNASTGASGYQVRYGQTSTDENTVSAGNVTQFTVTNLENQVQYVFAVSALSQPAYFVSVTAVDNTPDRNESELAPGASISVGSALESPRSNELLAVPEELVPYPDLPDEGCFVATAAFGADWVAPVQVLRDFRDRFLVTNGPGRAFVRYYYRHGPLAAAWLNRHAVLKPLVRAALWPAVLFAALLLGSSAAVLASAFLLLVALTIMIVSSGQRDRRRASQVCGRFFS